MGEALIGGLLSSGAMAPAEIAVVEVSVERRSALVERFAGVRVVADPVVAAGAVLAVKPPEVPAVAARSAELGISRILSLAAGVTLRVLDEAVAGAAHPVAVVRSMPNTPALVGRGAAAICGGAHATRADLEWAEEVLGAVGLVVRVPEHQMDAVTGLSGSGPAYAFLVAEALIDAGVAAGLPRDVAEALTVQTLLGSAAMLSETGDHPAALRNAVTSPGGTTAAGLAVLEEGGLRAALAGAVAAATARSRQLGSS